MDRKTKRDSIQKELDRERERERHFIDNNIKAFIFLCVSGYFAIFSSFMIQNKLIKNKYSLKSIIYADSKESALSKLLLTLKVFNNC